MKSFNFNASAAAKAATKAKTGTVEPLYVTNNRDYIKQEILKTIETRASEGKSYVRFSADLLSDFRDERHKDGNGDAYGFFRHALYPPVVQPIAPRLDDLEKAFTYLKVELTTWLQGLDYIVNSDALSYNDTYIYWLNETQLALFNALLADRDTYRAFEAEYSKFQENTNCIWNDRNNNESKIKALEALPRNNSKRKELPALRLKRVELLDSEKTYGSQQRSFSRRRGILDKKNRELTIRFQDSIGVAKRDQY